MSVECGRTRHRAPSSRSRRLAVVGPVPPPAGGMAGQTAQLVRLLRSSGIDVEHLPTNAPYRPGWVSRIWGVRAIARLVPYLVDLWRLHGRVDAVHLMANSGWSWFLFAWPVLIVGRMRDVPVLINYRGGHAATFLSRWGVLVLPAMRKAAAVVVPSGFLEAVFRKHGLCPQVIPNIIDTDLFTWRAPKQYIPSSPHIVVARNLEPVYGIDTAVRIFARVHREIPEARLSIAGSGPMRERLQQFVDSLGLSAVVSFTGSLDRQGMARLYTTADVVLNCSVADNMPNAILEAMASGVPIATTDAGGIPYIVNQEREALLFRVGDPNAGAAAVVRLIRERDLACVISERARRAVEAYSWDAVRNQWLRAYGDLLKRTEDAA